MRRMSANRGHQSALIGLFIFPFGGLAKGFDNRSKEVVFHALLKA